VVVVVKEDDAIVKRPAGSRQQDAMKFCAVCDNMLYVDLDADGGLLHVCKSCANVVRADREVVLDTNYVDDYTRYKQYMTPYLKHDPTLPRSTTIPCANGDRCTRPAGAPSEVLYVKYDAVNLRFLYNCVHCDAFWKSVYS
jgi:DNA-directed RNA polymerase subunit M/transcription elongation factor TFIIS